MTRQGMGGEGGREGEGGEGHSAPAHLKASRRLCMGHTNVELLHIVVIHDRPVHSSFCDIVQPFAYLLV
jgi:hypothetical protein